MTTNDEQLAGFRGRCKFCMYVPKKPAKYGIKTHALTDATVWYISWNLYWKKTARGIQSFKQCVWCGDVSR